MDGLREDRLQLWASDIDGNSDVCWTRRVILSFVSHPQLYHKLDKWLVKRRSRTESDPVNNKEPTSDEVWEKAHDIVRRREGQASRNKSLNHLGSDYELLVNANQASSDHFHDRGRYLYATRDLDEPDAPPKHHWERSPDPTHSDRMLASSFANDRNYHNRSPNGLPRPKHYRNAAARSRYEAHDTGDREGGTLRREHFVDHGSRDGGRPKFTPHPHHTQTLNCSIGRSPSHTHNCSPRALLSCLPLQTATTPLSPSSWAPGQTRTSRTPRCVHVPGMGYGLEMRMLVINGQFRLTRLSRSLPHAVYMYLATLQTNSCPLNHQLSTYLSSTTTRSKRPKCSRRSRAFQSSSQ